MKNLIWLEELIQRIPLRSKKVRSIYELSGFPYWENVNSNILSYYFDEEEDHGLGRLFFHSLLDVVIRKGHLSEAAASIFESEFQIKREADANGKRIDILFESKEHDDKDNPAWAIIIENKLFASVTNNFAWYARSVKSSNKLCILLSLGSLDHLTADVHRRTGFLYLSVTHLELIFAIKSRAAEYLLNADGRQFMLLKEYILNIENMDNSLDRVELEKQMRLIQSHSTQITELHQIQLAVNDYSVKVLIEVMSKFGFYPYTRSSNAKSKHFYSSPADGDPTNSSRMPYFRFFVELEQLMLRRSMTIHFELFGDYAKYGDELRRMLVEQVSYADPVILGPGGGVQYSYFHIFSVMNFTLPHTDNSWDTSVESFLLQTFFNPANNLVSKSNELMRQLLINKS